MTPGPEVQLYTREEVCALLKVSGTTLWRMEQRGQLVPVIVCGSKRYRRLDIDAIISGTLRSPRRAGRSRGDRHAP